MQAQSALTAERGRRPIPMTRNWGAWKTVSLYLDRCQVDTPDHLVSATWAHVDALRPKIGKTVDYGAGDGRFAKAGRFKSYVGYEIDPERCANAHLPKHAVMVNRCAFSDEISDADLCIGNPPFVRNQDLPSGWRQKVSALLKVRTGISLSGLANAWQYFFLLSLTSAKADGLVALVIPYEWVSRPSSKSVRDYILSKGWAVSVYRLVDTTFDSVLTTSSITIVDKADCSGRWRFFEERADGTYKSLSSPSGSGKGVLKYLKRKDVDKAGPRAIRGLSPGTQTVLTLTEGERVRTGLRIGQDVVPCVTSLRALPIGVNRLDATNFNRYYKMAGQKCWLLRTDKKLSPALSSYLKKVPAAEYQTSTCLERERWWEFKMPAIPALLMSQSFRGRFPKAVKNIIAARAVGGVCGIYNVTKRQGARLAEGLDAVDIRSRLVAHSNGLRKIEINQLNTLLSEAF
jgi:methylase of polypeptide subunit release factors